jgi:hypothetical protein
MTTAARKKKPGRRKDPELRARARRAYEAEGSYRKAGKRLGISAKRVHQLVNDDPAN